MKTVALPAALAGLLLLAPSVRGQQKAPAANVQGAPLTRPDGRIRVKVEVWTAPGVLCHAEASHRAKGRAQRTPTQDLLSAKTGASGGGRWTFMVAQGLPAGTWQVRVTCALNGTNLVAEPDPYKFFAATEPGDRRYSKGLVEPGTLTHAAIPPPSGGPNAG